MAGNKIDKNSFVPPYYQLARILERKILSGELKPGDSLPSETDLGREYELSRMTVRKCLNVLAERGLVYARQGRGTFVSRPALDRAVFTMEEFHQDMHRRGLRPEARLIAARVLRATREVAARLALAEGERVLHFCRLLLADKIPVALERKYMRYNRGRPVLENELQYRAFAEVIALHNEVLPVRSRMMLQAGVAAEEDALLLQIPPGSPVLCVEQVLFAADDNPVGYGFFVYRGDRYTLVSEVRPLTGGD
ncbi:UTRA domain-containing protein [Desulfofundulus thermobenzoicus]|uniref:UTRA domain-containing protein n=1 Tax=Desulfofundulus thermobenzoicus TaxID=29376 RepID=A0A6N7IRG0_9FIRM|nr:GntR family transcriptional regulator [Desulfofundulus thermobenzoicus]MQL52705.1 UTRA domain-containing protein [Desulfofundulus thermobenzoicus]HHW44716.1 GntR family transcriptional regulator [Desulfotomaculum sp.]